MSPSPVLKQVAANRPLRQPPSAGVPSRPLVYDPHGAIIISDSDEDIPPRPSGFIPPKLKESVTQLIHDVSLNRQGKKRVYDDDDDDAVEERAHEARLREKTRVMQVANERVTRKLKAAKEEVGSLKAELEAKNATMEELRQHCDCEICLETLWKPWALPDCGHIFCQTCLMSLFKAERFKCPTCRVRIRHRPVESYAFKNMLRVVAGPAPAEEDPGEEGACVWDSWWPSADP
ncbi:hypothetical protein AURDEDRAFT_164475 [Auricularia subglabra TFB-10046 SS5]|nr:hypothetical protein AURDEDRAFT_164475 [Auricularia subglabra TFB-10046 SS5]